ncbi:MAG: hypothetical protein PUD04_11725 [Firmicutes bacterium]|nr:hypothetical protein [Bacillota bacterium]
MNNQYVVPFYISSDDEWEPDGSGPTPFSLRNQVRSSVYLAPDGSIVDYYGNPIRKIK